MSRVFFGHPPAATGAQVVVTDATALTLTIPSPTVVLGAIARVADPTALTFTLPNPTIVKTNTLVADPISLSFAIPTATVVKTKTVVADAIPLTFAIPSPSIIASQLVTASPIALSFALPAPTVFVRQNIVPEPIPLAFTLPTPTRAIGALTVIADAVPLLFALPAIDIVTGVVPVTASGGWMPGRRSRRTKKEDLIRFGMDWLIDPAERGGPDRVERAPAIARALVAEARAARARGEPYIRGGLLEIPRDLVIPLSDLQPVAIMPDIIGVIRTARARAETKKKRDALDRYARHLAARARDAIEAEIEAEDEEMVLSAEGWW